MNQRMTNKVVAYVTRGADLLVFRQPHSPDAGLQVPAGTVEPGESLESAALREVREETGLDRLEIRSFLGTRDHDMRAFGRDETQRRSFFHLIAPDSAPETWTHFETDGGRSRTPIEFRFSWVRLTDGLPDLIAGQGALLDGLLQPSRGRAPITEVVRADVGRSPTRGE